MYRPEYAKLLAHMTTSPPAHRADGPLSNMQEFAEAFSCMSGDPMVRPLRAEIW